MPVSAIDAREDLMTEPSFIPLPEYEEYPVEESVRRAQQFHQEVERRRTVRDYSDREISPEILESCLRAAGTAPSGANLQPWHFVVVRDPEVKKQIRLAAEEEEREFYEKRAPQEWLDALAPLGTDENKPFLERAPALIAVFAQRFGNTDDGKKIKHYYAVESVGLATGILITALHHAGLATLTHTPSPMKFLNEILKRPSTETPFLLLVVGYPESGTVVPNIQKKPLDEIATFV